MFRNLFLAITITSICGSLYAQDQIVKNTGEEIYGKVIRINANEVIYKRRDNLEGPEYAELKSNIQYIKYENGQKDFFSTTSLPPDTEIAANSKPLKRKNSMFFEAGGNGIYASVNYERKIFLPNSYNFFAIKMGLGPFGSTNILNFTSTFNVGEGKNYFEIGGGGGVYTGNLLSGTQENSTSNYGYFTPVFGYRRQSQSGFVFRAFVTAIALKQDNVTYNYASPNTPFGGEEIHTIQFKYYSSVGVSVGFSF